MTEALIALLGSLTGLSAAATAFLWRAQRKNNNGQSFRDMYGMLRQLNTLMERQGGALDAISRSHVESQKIMSDALLGFTKPMMELSSAMSALDRRLNDVWIRVSEKR